MNYVVGILDAASLPIAVMAAALAVVFLTDRRVRQVAYALFCLAPLLPLFALRLAALGVVIGVDRLLQMRWADPFVGPARRLDDATEDC